MDKLKSSLRVLGACCLVVAFMLGACYYGMSKDLCRRIDTFSIAEQEAMQLTKTDCKKYYYY